MIEPQWLTYREAAERLGITADAVARRARRHKWPKLQPNRPGNPVRIQVPGDQLRTPPPPPPAPQPAPAPPPDAELTNTIAALQAEVTHLTDLAEQERRIAAIERRDRLEMQRQFEDLLAQVNAAQREVDRARYAADASGRGLVEAGRRIADLEHQLEEARAALKKHERRWWKRLF
jgi:type VI protein secretion system component VasF